MNKIIKKIRDLLKNREEIVFAYVYGSFNEVEKPKDIDIGVYITKVKDEIDYSLDLSNELSKKLNIPIDVRVINNAPIGFKQAVLQGKIILSKDDDFLDNFIEKTSREYMDFYELSKQFLFEVLSG